MIDRFELGRDVGMGRGNAHIRKFLCWDVEKKGS